MFIGENPIHIERGDIAELVLMPGDPLRAKYIAENYLDNYKLVTSIRNMLGYTGYYNGKKVTVMGSGMGMPSASIYVFELIHYFNVKKIIRIGTCGAVSPKVGVGEVILGESVFSESNFAYTYNDFKGHVVHSDSDLNNDIVVSAMEKDIKLHIGMLTTMDAFGPYIGCDRVLNRIPKHMEILGEEMEAFGIIHVANSMNAKATCMATTSDSKFSEKVLTPEERQKNLDDMIILALEAITR